MANAKPVTDVNVVQLELTVAELSYLLQTLGATTLWGGDPQPLFPKDVVVNEAQLIQGLADLKAHNWLRPAEDSQPGQTQWNLDRTLAQLVATVADPTIVLVITNYPAVGVKEVVCYYFTADAIVELVATPAETYRLLALSNYALLWQRLSSVLPLSATVGPLGATYTLSEAEFRHLAQLARTPSDATTAQTTSEFGPALASVYKIIATARPLAEIELGRIAARQLRAGYNLTLLADSDQTWLLYYATTTTLMVEPATKQAILSRLQAWWAELTGVPAEN